MTDKSRLLVINIDECPITDNPVIKYDCTGCKYYESFEMYRDLPCIKCSWSYKVD